MKKPVQISHNRKHQNEHNLSKNQSRKTAKKARAFLIQRIIRKLKKLQKESSIAVGDRDIIEKRIVILEHNLKEARVSLLFFMNG
jgi:hypothetical protein